MASRRLIAYRIALLAGLLAARTATAAASELPPAADIEADFARDIEPIFQKHCYSCHGEDIAMNGYSLWRSKEAKRGGYSGLPAITSGDSAGSRLIRLVAGLEDNLVMPPTGGRLGAAEIAILRAWIDQGAKWSRRPNESKREAEQPWLHMDYGPVISAAFTVREPEDPRTDKAPGDNVAYKGHAIALNEEKSAAVLFDTELLRYAAGWTGDFLALTGTVFDWKHGPHPYVAGDVLFENPMAPGWARDGSFEDPRKDGFGRLPDRWAKYRGRYVHGERTVLAYTVGHTPVLELPGFQRIGGFEIFTRTFEIEPTRHNLVLQLAWHPKRFATPFDVRAPSGHGVPRPQITRSAAGTLIRFRGPMELNSGGLGAKLSFGGASLVVGVAGIDKAARWDPSDPHHIRLRVPALNETQRFKVYMARVPKRKHREFGDIVENAVPPESPTDYTQGGPTRFPQTVKTQGKRGTGAGPYVIDELTLPFDNPWKSWMRPGDFAFFSDDRAVMTTWSGDVWIVSGVDDDLAELTWKRYATGFHQPLGVEVVDGVVYVLDRNQVTRLHDLNGDGEADFYENFNNDFHATHHFHEFTFDLDTDREGNFYFAKAARHALPAKVEHHGTIMKLDPAGKKLEVVCNGFRVPNGVAVGPNGEITTSDQEGHWIPSTRINWCSPGSFHGNMWGGGVDPERTDYDPPITFLPVDVDNSGAGQAWVDSKRWGPFEGGLVHSSFGQGKIFLMLMERVGGAIQDGVIQGGVIQGGATPFPLDFDTGLMRPAFRAQDGQLYLCGLYGWGTKKKAVGGFYRVRYTGKPLYMPVELHVSARGVEITFTQPLDPASAEDAGNYTARRWNYKWTSRYGSDLFRLDGDQGTETMTIRSARLSGDEKTVLLDIDDLREVMQMQISFRLKAADGTPITQEIHHTVNKLSTRRGKELVVEYE